MYWRYTYGGLEWDDRESTAIDVASISNSAEKRIEVSPILEGSMRLAHSNHIRTHLPGARKKRPIFFTEGLLVCLMQPLYSLVDHGHFQYNCVANGLVVWTAVCVTSGRPMLGALLFSLALNFKQMHLYFALPVFFYLLSTSLYDQYGVAKVTLRGVFRVVCLGIIVISTFTLLWAPFCVYPSSSCSEGLLQVVTRIFPVDRGVFEDKVASFWCSLNVFIKIKQLVSLPFLGVLCLLSTLVVVLPSNLDLIIRPPTTRRFLWALFNTSLGFFLFSFHVHEKTILLPLVPMSLLAHVAPGPSFWFGLVACFSCSPLLFRDGLWVAYVGVLLGFISTAFHMFGSELMYLPLPRGKTTRMIDCRVPLGLLTVVALGLQIGHAFVPPPPRLPDLWVVLISLYACACFCVFLLYGNWCQYKCDGRRLKQD